MTDSWIKDKLHAGIDVADPAGVADLVFARASKKRTRQAIMRGVLVVTVVSATAVAFVGARSVFESGTGPADGTGPTDAPVAQGPGLSAALGPVAEAPPGLIVFGAADQSAPGQQALFTVDPRTGKVLEISGIGRGAPELVAWSPDRTQIAFTMEDRHGIYAAASDGSGVRRLARSDGYQPSWSPDGQRIAFVVERGEPASSQEIIYTVAVDGTDVREVGPGIDPDWSPDGRHFAFTNSDTGELNVMDVDGSNIRSLGVSGYHPDWSPDGSTIAFVDCQLSGARTTLCQVNADGSNLRILADSFGYYSSPDWSPDGTWLAFAYDRPEWEKRENPGGVFPQEQEVYIMRADGSDVHRLTDLATPRTRNSSAAPDWTE